LADFFSISPNQIKFLLSACLVPGLGFSAIPVSISAVSLERLSTYVYTFLDFKVANWKVSSLTHSHILQICLFHYSSFQNCIMLTTTEFLVISADCLLGNGKSIAKFLMRTFPLYLPL
jgi:hypothetical protein